MFRGLIYDNLLEQFRTTKPCNTETEAREEAKNKIERLSNSYKVSVSDGRFYLESIEITK
jgi:hypothetical protein